MRDGSAKKKPGDLGNFWVNGKLMGKKSTSDVECGHGVGSKTGCILLSCHSCGQLSMDNDGYLLGILWLSSSPRNHSNLQCPKIDEGEAIWRDSIVMGASQNGWFIRENPVI